MAEEAGGKEAVAFKLWAVLRDHAQYGIKTSVDAELELYRKCLAMVREQEPGFS